MSDSVMQDELPDVVVKFLQRLERVTGRVPLGQAVLGIVAIGVLATALATGAVTWAEQYRVQQAFEAASARLQVLMQDQMDQRAGAVHQLAGWATHQAASGQVTAWHHEGLAIVRPDDIEPGLLGQLLPIENAQVPAIKSCLNAVNTGRARKLCRLVAGNMRSETWFLVERIDQPRAGWVVLAMHDQDLAVSLDDGIYWRTQAMPITLGSSQWALQGATAAADHGDLRQIDQHVHVAGSELPVLLIGEARVHGWADSWSRLPSLWMAGGAGLLFTLGGLHAYLMLISTRRRAKEMADEMSAALQHTQSRNQAMMDTAPDAIIMTDGQGLVRWCNQATTSIFGRTQEQLLGQSIGVILRALDHETVDEWFANHGYSNRVIGYQSMGSRAEGTAFPVAMSASRVQLDNELILTFIVRDTTDAKWAEQELTLRDRALAASADGVIIASMTLPNQPVIYVNQAFERITGFSADEVLGVNCKLLQRADVDQPGVAIMRQAIREGRSCQVVLRNYRKDGSLFYNDLAISPVLSPEGVVTHYVGVQNDITDRIAAEQVLKLRTERLNAVFELSPDGFVVLDKRGEVSIVNPSFERMTGMRAADMVGQSQDAFEEALMARCKASEVDDQSAEGVIAGQGSDAEVGNLGPRELLHMHTPCARTLVRRVRRGGHDNETVMYFRDITLELEVDRMKSEFLAMAAHELRTPMVSIFGFTELLLKRTFTEERRQDMLGTIHKQASILINLVNELLDLARIEARRGKDFKRLLQPIGPIIEQVLDGLKVPGDRRKVRLKLDAADVQVWADTEKLGQAILNVLSNAYKYSPEGGEIQMQVRHDEPAQQLIIEVRDHGIGMSPDQLARVFERFFRADPSGNIPGTGLGMSLVKEIVSLHQGEVTVSSEVGEGTTVRMAIPAQEPPDSRGVLVETKESTV